MRVLCRLFKRTLFCDQKGLHFEILRQRLLCFLRVCFANGHHEENRLVTTLSPSLLFLQAAQRNGHLLAHWFIVSHPLRGVQPQPVNLVPINLFDFAFLT